jgi:beta-glucanase (GH16 family)
MNSMKLLVLLSVLSLPLLSSSQYTLIWSDEFDTATLNPLHWAHEVGGWGWGNNEWQYYTSGNNLSIEDGILILEARKEQQGGNDYTSAKISSKGLFEVQYGKIEARIKYPTGQGLWPAFWMLGANIDDVSWPQCGEIDILEHINNDWTVHGTAHWDDNGHVYYGTSQSMSPLEFHVYAIEWDNQGIRWFVDGQQYHVMDISNGINSTSEFHNPFYLILNLAVGGDWPGYPDCCTDFPAQMLVDYVRVFEMTP